jgi:hypothetical protein
VIDFNFFLCLLGAHFCGDVFAYTPALSKHKRDDKKTKMLSALILHGFIHSLFCLLWLFWEPFTLAALSAIAVFFIHSFIDSGRVLFENRIFGSDTIVILTWRDILSILFFQKKNFTTNVFFQKFGRLWLLLNIVDQSLHCASLMVISSVLPFFN